MNSLRLNFEWLEAAPSPDQLAQATMARLDVRVGNDPITRAVDSRSRAVRDAVIVPLLPLCEWIVSHWWALWFEVDMPGTDAKWEGFESRHDLSHAGDGFVLPRLRICSLGSPGDSLLLRSLRTAFSHAEIEFLSECEHVTDRASVELQFRTMIEATIERLQSRGYHDTWLEREWQALGSLEEDEKEFCQAAALLGLDPLDVPDDVSGSVLKLWNQSDPALREDMFACAEVHEVDSVAEWVRDSVKQLAGKQSGAGWKALRADLVKTPEPPPRLPWERGYDMARRARKQMGLTAPAVEFESAGKWAVSAAEVGTPIESIDGLVASDGPSLITRKRSSTGLRFLHARAIGDFLGRPWQSASLLTSGSTCRQKQSRAFAAEFLAPSNSLRDRTGGPTACVTTDTMDELAEEFGVSSYVIRHQIQNHQLGKVLDTV